MQKRPWKVPLEILSDITCQIFGQNLYDWQFKFTEKVLEGHVSWEPGVKFKWKALGWLLENIVENSNKIIGGSPAKTLDSVHSSLPLLLVSLLSRKFSRQAGRSEQSATIKRSATTAMILMIPAFTRIPAFAIFRKYVRHEEIAIVVSDGF